MFFNKNIPYICEYKMPLKYNYEELISTYSKLKDKVEKIVEHNTNNREYEDKIKHYIDMSVISKEKNSYFAKYEIEISKRIDQKINKNYLLDEENLIAVLKLRKQLLEFNDEIVSMETVGTTLNYLREFYKDLELDIAQNCKYDLNVNFEEDSLRNYVSNFKKADVKKPVLTSNEEFHQMESDKNKWVVTYG